MMIKTTVTNKSSHYGPTTLESRVGETEANNHVILKTTTNYNHTVPMGAYNTCKCYCILQ